MCMNIAHLKDDIYMTQCVCGSKVTTLDVGSFFSPRCKIQSYYSWSVCVSAYNNLSGSWMYG